MEDGGRIVDAAEDAAAAATGSVHQPYHDPLDALNDPAEGTLQSSFAAPVVDAAAPFSEARGAVRTGPEQGNPVQGHVNGAPAAADHNAQPAYSLMEVAKHLQVSPDALRSWNVRFAQVLHIDAAAETPRYSSADVGVLLTIQKLIDQRLNDDQVIKQLMPRRIEPERNPAALAALAVQRAGDGEGGISSAAQALTDVLSVIAGSQQNVLNSQSSMREMVTVVVQDNFNLKDENRKLRDRMLELERALAEYQRREETRKERMEARMRALEGTVAALQQQMAQFVQLQRAQARKKGFW